MNVIDTDVLVIGAGAAGIRAALAASEEGANVTMINRTEPANSGSTFSNLSGGWGIQALLDDERTEAQLEPFYEEIVKIGLGICDLSLVRILVEESVPRLKDLITYGLRLKKDPSGNYLRVKGCFSKHERAFITESMANIKKTFQAMLNRSRAKVINGSALELIKAHDECWGAWILTYGNHMLQITAKSTILATGGGAGIYRDHLVGDDQVGEGYALAHRIGAKLINLEFIQFMPGLQKGGTRLFLPLSDLQEPDMLLDSEGHDLLEAQLPYPLTRAEVIESRKKHFPFSCRDVSYLVDIAIAMERDSGREVFWGKCQKMGESIRVVHYSHAFNGGIKINERAESTIPGLFAAGEVAAGCHGADRIGGCMMTATQVFGKRAGKFAALRVKKTDKTAEEITIPENILKLHHHMPLYCNNESPNHIVEEIRETFSQETMLLRNKNGLTSCLSKIKRAKKEIEEHCMERYVANLTNLNMLQVMELIARVALKRNESMGPHYRSDYPPESPS